MLKVCVLCCFRSLCLLTCKNRLPYNLYCVGGDVKHYTIKKTQNVQGEKQVYQQTQVPGRVISAATHVSEGLMNGEEIHRITSSIRVCIGGGFGGSYTHCHRVCHRKLLYMCMIECDVVWLVVGGESDCNAVQQWTVV